MEAADLTGLFAAHRVAVAYLFGSRAEGTARPDSDHDLAVLFTDRLPTFDATERLATDLARTLDTEVDVVDLDRSTLELRGRVAERGRLLYSADEPRHVRFEVDARLRWIEFRPVLRETHPGLPAAGRDGGSALMVDPDRVDDERLARAVREGGLDDLSAFATAIAALAVE